MQPSQVYKFCQFLIDCEAETYQDNKSYQVELKQHRRALDDLITREQGIAYFIDELAEALLEDKRMILRDKKNTQPNSSITKELDKIIDMLHKGTFFEYCRGKEVKHKDLLSILLDAPAKTKATDKQTGLTVKEVVQSKGNGIPLLNGFVQANQRQNRRG